MLPYISSASTRHSSVLPTPVGPVNIRQATGRFSSRTPQYPRRTASATARTALCCPLTPSSRRDSRLSSRSRSPAVSLPTGIPVRAETAQATSKPVTARLLFPSAFFATIRCILSRSSAAFSNWRCRTASCSSCSNSCRAVLRRPAPISSIRAWAAPSSNKSMALSGKNKSGK